MTPAEESYVPGRSVREAREAADAAEKVMRAALDARYELLQSGWPADNAFCRRLDVWAAQAAAAVEGWRHVVVLLIEGEAKRGAAG